MRTVKELDIGVAAPSPALTQARRVNHSPAQTRQLIMLAITLLIGLWARTYRLDAAGLAEDEANKIFALRCYSQGDLTVNGEHPMLMKLMCFASVRAADKWNSVVGTQSRLMVSEEAALRLPNALFGALTVIPLFVLANVLFGDKIALISAVFWALGLDAIWFNRIAKEDTLLVFFMFAGFCLYALAKQRAVSDERGAERLYLLAGAAFGLMIASKYFPHYLGLNSLYYTLIGYDSRNNRPVGRRGWAYFFGAIILAFVAFNPGIFVPQTWRYLWRYLNEELLTHHGYLVAGKLFINDMAETPGGNPWYFYLLFVAVKMPLPIVIAFLAGLVEVFRHRGHYPSSRGYLFLRLMLVFWLFPMSIAGTKFLRYSLSLMPVLYMTSAVGAVALWRLLANCLQNLSVEWQTARRAAAWAVGVLVIAASAVTSCRAVLSSFPGLYMSPLARARAGFFFPHDEFYDLGARESIKYVAETAPPGARLASEIPGVVEYYLERYGRSDIRSEIISQPKFDLVTGRPDYVMLQPGRVYIENLGKFSVITRDWSVAQSSEFQGVNAATVYRPPELTTANLNAKSPR
jgi:hypothetical protein